MVHVGSPFFPANQPIFPKVPPEKMTADSNDMGVSPEANAIVIFCCKWRRNEV